MKKNFKTVSNTSLKNKTVIVRLDLNVPMKNGKIVDPQKIIEALPTLTILLNNNCKIIVLSHLGRIKSQADIQSKKYSLAPIADFLSQKLGRYSSGVYFLEKNYGPEVKEAVDNLQNKEILVLENTRYADLDEKGKYIGWESKNDPKLAKFWSKLGQFFIYDAFATIHRKHASTYGIGYYHKKTSAIGLLVERELKNIENAMKKSGRPTIAIIGGAKVNDKINLIEKLTKIADVVLVGGALAFTFLAAKGYDVGDNYIDHSKIKNIQELLKKSNNKIILPMDFACVINKKSKSKKIYDVMINQTLRSMSAYDIGNEAIADFTNFIIQAKTIIWNGPLGKFENKRFSFGTKAIAKAIAYATKYNNAYSLIAGGDTGNAIKKFKLVDKVSYISTGGGATFALICNESLPGLENINTGKANGQNINEPIIIRNKNSSKKAKVIKIDNVVKEINEKPLINDDPSGNKVINNLVDNAKRLASNRAKKQKAKDNKFIKLNRQKAISNEVVLDKNIENFVPKMNSNNKIKDENKKSNKKSKK